VSSSCLADLTLAQVSERLGEYGSSLHGEAEDAILSLLQALESGLTGDLENAYHLAAIDPGMGKTLSVTTFLKTWKQQEFAPLSSVLIGLSRLAEIPKYLEGAGLDRSDVAILTSDKDLNDRGVSEDCHGEAPIMFTTQQMIERRTRGKTFSELTEFHYRGKPRSLRIWDESLIPAEPLTIRADALACLPAAMRRLNPEFVSHLQPFLTRLWGLKDRERVMVPEVFPELIDAAKGHVGRDTAALLDALSRLAGRTGIMVDTGKGDMHLAGASAPLPPDFSPAVILDASGRVRETYRIWERALGDLRRLPAVVKDYSNLTVNLWERRAGQEAMKVPGTVEEIVRAVAEAIDSGPERDWLVIHYMDHPVEAQLRAVLKTDMGTRLNFLHWGNHHGTNDFAHCRNVVSIGQLTYGAASYPAHLAACGAMPSRNSERQEQGLKAGEYRHNLLQALTRASARNSKGTLAGNCRAFVVASPNMAASKLLGETFPGCTILPWKPSGQKATGKAKELIDILQAAAADGSAREIAKKDLARQLDVKSPNLSALLSHPSVVAYLDQHGMKLGHRDVAIRQHSFAPYSGMLNENNFSIEDLEKL
jgi:hypothetical protein